MTDDRAGAWKLLGLKLDNDWEVFEAVGWDPATGQKTDIYGGTGGHFSVAYKVRKGERVAFLKALDLSDVMTSPLPVTKLLEITQAHNFEDRLLQLCSGAKMDKVVVAIDSGTIRTGNNIQDLAPYLIFDLAEGDVRRRIQKLNSDSVRIAWWLRAMHHTAIGLSQLHSKRIFHQDLKPSNILSFGASADFKVSDLGRAEAEGLVGPHSGMIFAGDLSYAPLEILYQGSKGDEQTRRFSCDLYMLGSMIFFFCLKFGATQIMISKLQTSQRPFPFGGWTGSYKQIEPLLQKHFTDLLEDLKLAVEGWSVGEDLLKTAAELCNPEPEKRGHPLSHAGAGNPFSLERYISLFDQLAKRAEIEARGSAA